MTQSIIISKFIKFLEYKKIEYFRNLDDQILLHPERTEQITQQKYAFLERTKKLKEKLPKGCCFGFSLTHAAMDYMNKLDWWEQVLIEIANWDEESSSLSKELKLPGAIQATRLNDIMERAFDYILTSQSEETEYFFSDIDQSNILQPDGYNQPKPASRKDITQHKSRIKRSYFEILDEEENQNHVKTIKKRVAIAGNLTKEQLMRALADDMPEKSIILVHGPNHSIRLGRKGTQWMVYNPNYSHQPETIHKITNKSDCIDEIFRSHGSSFLAIEVAYFDKNRYISFPEYADYLKTSGVALLYSLGFFMMARYTTEALYMLVKHIDNSPEGKELLQAMSNAITEKNSNGWNALQAIARYSPQVVLYDLIKHVKDNSAEGKELLRVITRAITEKNSDGWTTLHVMARFSPVVLYFLIQSADYLSEGKGLLQAITKAITEKNSGGSTALHMLARYSPDALHELIKHADNSPEGKKLLQSITMALTEQDSSALSGLNMMSQYAPKALSSLFTLMFTPHSIQLLLDMPKGLDRLLKILSAEVMNKRTTWQYVCNKFLGIEAPLINIICKHLSKLTNEELILYKKELDQALFDEKSRYRGLCKKNILFYQHHAKTNLYRNIQTTIQQTIEKNLLELMEKHNLTGAASIP